MSPAEDTQRAPRPLEGLRVCELSIAIAGPVCGRYLAHFGAEVIKVESARHPDVIRLLGSTWLERNRYGAQTWGDCGWTSSELMTGKRSVGLDLKAPAGLEVAKRLLERSDVFISNYSAPAVAALGLDYESVRAVKPDIVYAAISGFGCDPATPYYDFVSWGPNQGPLAGLDDLTGWPDRPPAGVVTVAYPDFTNGIHAAIAVLAALDHRDRTGEGQMIDLSQQEATVAMLGSALLECDLTHGAAPRRNGNRHPRAAPHGIYPCQGRERWVALSVFNDVEWQALCRVAKMPGWARDPRLRTLEDRLANQHALDELVTAWTRDHFDSEIAEWLQRAGVAAAPVLDDPRVAIDPQLEARGFWILADHRHLGKDLATGNPIHLRRTPGYVERASPALGEDNDYTLGRVCGYSAPEIQRLVDAGAVFPMVTDVELERPYLRWIRHFMPTLDWPGDGRYPMAAVLEGYRVIDLAGEPGLYAAKLLADLGADVVRIDGPGSRRDPSSTLSRDAAGNGLVYFNTGKRSITLDLEKPEAAGIFRKLAERADVVCESFAPGALAERGLGYEEIARLHPGIVWVSITPFGQSGPRRDWKGSNLVGWAGSGVPPSTGDPDRAPLVPGGSLPLAYILASLNAAVGALVALRARRRGGQGQLVDVSVHESTVAAATEVGVPGFLDDLVARGRYGPRRPVLAPTAHYRTTDGYAAVVILSTAHWEALARWIAEKTGIEAATDPMFRDVMVRRDNWQLLEEWTQALTSQYSKQELFEEGQRRGISITPVNRVADVAVDAQLRARGYWVEVDDPVLGRITIPGAPYRFAKTPWRTRPAPVPGSDNHAVYCAELGLSEEDLDRLSASGVV